MSIIIRLQNLPWEANSLDIRRYFQGLSIPDGGVHIVGGVKGDAFIAFLSDEDARQAMERDGGLIKNSIVKLYLSSRNEMQKFIDQARTQTLGCTTGGAIVPSPPMASNGQTGGRLPAGFQPLDSLPPLDILPPLDPPPQQDYVIFMKGIPYNSCTERDVAEFFAGLRVVDMVFEIDRRTGKPAGNAFVEFATNEDFNSALDMNMKHMGRRYIEIFPTSKDDMNEARMAHDRGGNYHQPPGRGGLGGRGGSGGEAASGTGGHNSSYEVANLPPSVQNHDHLTNYYTDRGGYYPPGRGGGLGGGRGVGGGGEAASGTGGPTSCVSVTNLPPTVKNHDLTNYFTDIGAQPFAIHIMLKPNGLNAGEAFVEFSSKEQQMKAIRRDNTFMEGQRISVRSVPYDLMRRVVGIPPGGHGPPPPRGGGGPINNGGMDGGPMRHGGGGGPMYAHNDVGGDPRKIKRSRRDDIGFRGRRGEKDGRRDGPHQGGGSYNSYADHH